MIFNKLTNQIRSFLNISLNDTVKQYLINHVPNYAFVERGFQNILSQASKKKLHAIKMNHVESSEINSILRDLKSDIVGVNNPISFMWKLLQSFVGMRRSARIANNLTTLREYSGDPDNSSRFVNNVLEKLLALTHKRINQLESIWSKLGIATTKTVLEDKTIQGLIETIKSEFQVFSNLVNGGVPGQGVSINDIRFLEKMQNHLIYGPHAKYLKVELAPAINEVLNQARQAVFKANPNIATSQGLMQESPSIPQTKGQRRNIKQQLAQAI